MVFFLDAFCSKGLRDAAEAYFVSFAMALRSSQLQDSDIIHWLHPSVLTDYQLEPSQCFLDVPMPTISKYGELMNSQVFSAWPFGVFFRTSQSNKFSFRFAETAPQKKAREAQASAPKHWATFGMFEVYWGYMRARARSFSVNFVRADELALVRLACLSRVQDALSFVTLPLGWCASKWRVCWGVDGRLWLVESWVFGHRWKNRWKVKSGEIGCWLESLSSQPRQNAWASLSSDQRETLKNHFLADGIEKRAIIFTFLPETWQSWRAWSENAWSRLEGPFRTFNAACVSW